MNLLTSQEWQEFIIQHPEAHILQTPSWGQLKSFYGWTPKFARHNDIGAMILFKHLPLGLTVAYLPRGPVGEGSWAELWSAIDLLCRKEHAVFLRVEPEVWQPVPEGFIHQQLPGFKPTSQTVQPRQTILLDISLAEDDLLMGMKSKTRYNIRLAERKNVVVSESDDVEAFYKMMLTTGSRDAFGIHSQDYYQHAYDLFSPSESCKLLIASFQGKPLAGLMAFTQGKTAWYFYGASTNEERNRMPTYLLQWEAIRWAKGKGCQFYDLWGIPDAPEAELEDTFMERSDGLWGVYRFKRGFGGEVKRTIGAWDRIYQPLLYKIYSAWSNRSQGLTPS